MLSGEQLSTQKSFYVGVSRMRDQTHLYTDDMDKLTSKITQETGDRVNALEALQTRPEDAKSKDQERDASPLPGTLTDREKATSEDAPKEAEKEASRDRDIGTKNRAEKPTEKDPIKAYIDTIENAPEGSPTERMIEALNINQKTRDERSR